jgi:hypothetical protein
MDKERRASAQAGNKKISASASNTKTAKANTILSLAKKVRFNYQRMTRAV